MDAQKPKWITEARKMISGCDSRVSQYWNNLEVEERRYFCFLAGLKGRHVQYTWGQFTTEEKVSLWSGILNIRRLQQETRFFTPEDFKGPRVCSVAPREIVQEVEQENQQPIH